MTLLKIAASLIMSVAASGCASTITAFKNDPLQHYDVKGPTVYAMLGDRRTTIFADQNSRYKYCAESLPDAVAAIAAATKGNLKTKGVEGGFSDETAVGLLQTFQRTENAELSRHMGWNVCLAWSQGAITNAQYHDLLQMMVVGTLEVMKTRALQEIKPGTAPNTLTVSVTPADDKKATASATATSTPNPAPSSTATPTPK